MSSVQQRIRAPFRVPNAEFLTQEQRVAFRARQTAREEAAIVDLHNRAAAKQALRRFTGEPITGFGAL